MTATPSPKGVEPKEPVPSVQISQTLKDYIEQLSKGLETDCYFPKNESSWEELFNLGEKLIAYAATLTTERDEAQKERDELRAANAKLEELVKRARGQLDAGLAALHGENTDEGEKKEWHKMEIS